MKGIAHALTFMHKHNIIHCDLKPENVLFDINMEPQLCDFGLSMSLEDDLAPRGGGTLKYIAPEILYAWFALKETNHKQNKASDMYAFALLCWCIVANMKEPYQYDFIFDKDDLVRWVCENKEREPIPYQCDPNVRHLIKLAWHHDPLKRPSAKDAFAILSDEHHDSLEGSSFHEINIEDAYSNAYCCFWKKSTQPSVSEADQNNQNNFCNIF